jgi:hypothetical protein
VEMRARQRGSREEVNGLQSSFVPSQEVSFSDRSATSRQISKVKFVVRSNSDFVTRRP